MMGARLHQDLSKILVDHRPHHQKGTFLKCLMCVTIVRVVGTSCRQSSLYKASDPKQAAANQYLEYVIHLSAE